MVEIDTDEDIAEYKVQCCMCEKNGYYLDLQDAYDHGWFAQDYGEYCQDHAQQGIWEADYGEVYTVLNSILNSI